MVVAPLRIYGGDARLQKSSVALILTWSNVCCRLESWLSRFLITMVPLNFALDLTMHGIYKVVAWSFKHILLNTWPSLDHNGNPFPVESWRHKRGRNKGHWCQGCAVPSLRSLATGNGPKKPSS